MTRIELLKDKIARCDLLISRAEKRKARYQKYLDKELAKVEKPVKKKRGRK